MTEATRAHICSDTLTIVHYSSFFPTGSSGSVSFTVNNRLQPLILTVTGTRTGGEVAITLVRDLRIGSSIKFIITA